MTPEEQRVAIAEACGWKRSDLRPSWCHPDNWSMAKNGSYEVWVSRDKLPDYLNDLNAMHDAEEMLTDDQWVEYRENIRTVVLGPVRYVSQWCKADIHSTARQRAEAFLRTIGKWKEAKPCIKKLKTKSCIYCMKVECECSDFDVSADMGAKG